MGEGSEAELRGDFEKKKKRLSIAMGGKKCSVSLGCLQATPSTSEAALVDPDLCCSTEPEPVADGPRDHRC